MDDKGNGENPLKNIVNQINGLDDLLKNNSSMVNSKKELEAFILKECPEESFVEWKKCLHKLVAELRQKKS
jgi:hypothetical protein